MSRIFQWAVISCAGFVMLPSLCQAQPPAPVQPKITTVDGVKLHATFYGTGKKSPVIIMVHPIGEGKNSKIPEWKALAVELQKKDFAVITFDLRGHGDSTTVDADLFWGKMSGPWDAAQSNNRKHMKVGKDPEVLEASSFLKNPGYLPTLVNDLAAVRAYLEKVNDAGECNTASILVIGAESGGTLAAIWMNSEWSRFKFTPAAPPVPMSVEKRSEGADIIGAVFLNIQPELGYKRPVKIPAVLKKPCRDNATAAAFFYGKDDSKSQKYAKTLESSLKVAKSRKHEFIGPVEIPDTSLSGMKLLQEGLNTDKLITKYLQSVVEERGGEWVAHDFSSSFYVWLPAPGIQIPAKLRKGDKNLNFDTYQMFVAQ